MSKVVKNIIIARVGAVDHFEFVSGANSTSIIQPDFDSNFTPIFPSSLDKLAQLSRELPKKVDDQGRQNQYRRAKAKYFTLAYLLPLIDLDSVLKKSYSNSIFCSHIIHQIDGKFTSRYCNARWCTVCNRIRIAKAINGYLPQLKLFERPYFITLTIPNIKAHELRPTIMGMIKTWRTLYLALKWHKITLKGIRKLECTFNEDKDDYHPHFHFIVEGKDLANRIILEWLQRYPAASRKAQDCREADEGSMLELFKYFTKIITKESVYIGALDVMFQAMAGLRTFQPFGIKKVSEEVEELQAEIIEDLVKEETFWEWMNCDWVEKGTNQCLTGYKPSEHIKKLIENIIY